MSNITLSAFADMVSCAGCRWAGGCQKRKHGATQCAQMKMPAEPLRAIAVEEARRRLRLARTKAEQTGEETDPSGVVDYLAAQYHSLMCDEADEIRFEREKAGGPKFLDVVDLGEGSRSTVAGEKRGGPVMRAGCSRAELGGIARGAAAAVVDCLLKCTQPESVDCAHCRASDCARKIEERL